MTTIPDLLELLKLFGQVPRGRSEANEEPRDEEIPNLGTGERREPARSDHFAANCKLGNFENGYRKY
jgi:hypothetical protein